MDLRKKLALLKDAGPGSRPKQRESHPEKEQTPKNDNTRKEETDETTSEEEERLKRLNRLREMIQAVMLRKAPRLPSTRAQSEESLNSPETVERPPTLPLDDDGRRISLSVRELPGGPQDTPFGTVHVALEHLEPGHCQGKTPILPALDVSPQTWAHLSFDPSFAGIDPRKMLFLDTETTGLVGGTGTVPFLVGLAYFDDQSLRVEQLFLRQLGQERPLLYRLSERIRQATMIVTYNGKTFDWPLLRTRFVMNMMDVPPELPHLDLLHCARRIYKKRLRELRLIHLEDHILGLLREHDVEGAEIPIRYLDYLRSGEEGQLVPVIEHNAHDLISLAAIMGRLGLHYERVVLSDEPEDHLGYAKVAQRAGDLDRAIAFAEAAARGGGSTKITVEALSFLANLYRIRGDVDRQEEVLQKSLEASGYICELSAPIHLALAKFCEHKRKDFQRALRHAEFAVLAEPEETNCRRQHRLRERIARDEANRQRRRQRR